MPTVAVFARIRTVNWLACLPCRTWSFEITPTLLNPLAPIARLRMAKQKTTTINSLFATRTLLYGAGLPAKYWSSALIHAAYLHNRLVHSITKHTPFKGFFGEKLNLTALRVFGSRVCVKRTGYRRSKLDRHDFTGVFIGYTATDNNIKYIDLDSGLVKTSHHAQFDEAWHLQDSRPPATQLLYDLGLEAEDDAPPVTQPDAAPYPPLVSKGAPITSWKVPPRCCHLSLPL